MSVNWNRLLARYQHARGGYFLGSKYQDCDSQLILPQEDRPPLLISFDEDPAGRYSYRVLKARTAVQLNGSYELNISARGLMSSGISGVMGALGKQDFGYPEATRGRTITTNNKDFTRKVLGDLDLRNALIQRDKEYLKVNPSPQGDGWHIVEVCADSFEGLTRESSRWVTEAIAQTQNISFMNAEDQEVLYSAADRDFLPRMDGFIGFLRAAQRAVTTWRM